MHKTPPPPGPRKRPTLIPILTNPYMQENGKHQNKSIPTITPEELWSCGQISTGLTGTQKVEGTTKKISSHINQLFLTMICFTSCSALGLLIMNDVKDRNNTLF